MNFKNIYRKAFIAAATLAPAAVFAEGEPSAGGDGFLTGLLADVKEAMLSALNEAGPVISAVITAGLAIWIAIALIGVIKRAFGAGKGR